MGLSLLDAGEQLHAVPSFILSYVSPMYIISYVLKAAFKEGKL